MCTTPGSKGSHDGKFIIQNLKFINNILFKNKYKLTKLTLPEKIDYY